MDNEVNTNFNIPASRAYVKQIVSRLLGWLPFTKKQAGGGSAIVQSSTQTNLVVTNENEIALGKHNISKSDTVLSVGVGTGKDEYKNDDQGHRILIAPAKKNAIEIKRNGKLYLLYTNDDGIYSQVVVQDLINNKVPVEVDRFEDAEKLIRKTNTVTGITSDIGISRAGKLIIVKENSEKGRAGIYIVSLDATVDGAISKLTKIAETATKDVNLEASVLTLETKVANIEKRFDETINMKPIPESQLTKEQLEISIKK